MPISSARAARLAAVALFVATTAGALAMLGGGRPSPSLGYVEEDRRVLGSTERGRLRALRVTQGQGVHAGDVLAELDPTQIDADIAALEAEALTLANRARTRATDVGRDTREVAARAVAAEEAARAARAGAAALREAIAQVEDRIARGLGGGEDLPSLRAEAVRADALAASLEGTAAAVRRSEVPDTTLSPDAAATAEVDAVQKQIAALRVTREALVIRAPVDGRVAAVLHRVGDAVEPGDVVVEVVAETSDRAVACVDAATAARLREGQRARLAQAAGDAAVGAHVLAIGPAFAPSDDRCRLDLYRPAWSLPVVLALDPGAVLVPGALVQVSWLDDVVPPAVGSGGARVGRNGP